MNDLSRRMVALNQRRALGLQGSYAVEAVSPEEESAPSTEPGVGTITPVEAASYLKRDGSRSLTGNLPVDAGVTLDGVDLSVHAANVDAHHAQSHSLASHSTKAHAELTDVSSDQHHAQLHAAQHVTGGNDVIANAVPAGNAGLMTGADKTKLDGIEALADVTDFDNVQAALAAASGAVAFNAQSLTGLGTLASAAGTLTIDETASLSDYLTIARGDARYYTETELDAGQLDNRYYTETEEDVWRAGVLQAEMDYLDGVTADIQDQLDARCLESVFGTSIGAGLLLDVAVLKASAILQKYHAINPSADVQSLLGCADEAAIRTFLDLEAGTDFYSVATLDAALALLAPIDAPTFTTSVTIAETAGVADYDKFLVTDTGVIKYRTGAEVLSDIGAQAAGNYQPLDTTLTSIALLGTAADKIAYTTDVDTWAEAAITAAGRALLDDANAAAQLVTLGALPLAGGTMTGVIIITDTSYFKGNAAQGYRFNNAADNLNLVIISDNGNTDIIQHDGATVGLKLGGTLVTVSAVEMNYSEGVTSAIQTQLDARCLESVFGTSIGAGLLLDVAVLKASAILQKYHAIDPSADVQSLLGCANEAAIRTFLDLEAGTDFYSVATLDAALALLAPIDAPTFTTSVTIAETAGVADYDKFLVTDTGVIKYRTGAEVLSDIGGSASGHNHDDAYYTETELDAGQLDNRYYTETEVNTWRSNVLQAEMDYLDGVTSDIQTQLDARQPLDATLTAFASLLTAANKIPYATNVDTGGELDLATTVGNPGSDTTLVSEQGIREALAAAAGHAMLDGSVHTDSVADAVTRGSIIYGNATPAWDELAKGAADTFLGSGADDISWRTAAQVLASLSGEAAAAFDLNAQNLTGVGKIYLQSVTGSNAVVDFSSMTADHGVYSLIQRTTGTNRSGRFEASGAGATTNYAVYANAAGATTNWAFYSSGGDSYFVANVDIADHNASTVGLKLGGTLVTASAAELNQLDDNSFDGSVLIPDHDWAGTGLFLNGYQILTGKQDTGGTGWRMLIIDNDAR